MLKVALYPETAGGPEAARTFSFEGPNATGDRDQFKDAITNILQKIRAKTSQTQTASGSRESTPLASESTAPKKTDSDTVKQALTSEDLKMRISLLKNKELGLLHQQLVLGGHISEEEFWETRQVRLSYRSLYRLDPSCTYPLVKTPSASTPNKTHYH